MKEDNKIYIIIICIMGAIILGLVYFCFFSDIFKNYKNTKKKAEGIIDKVTDKMDEQLDKMDDDNNSTHKIENFYGEYNGEKKFTNEYNNEITIKVTLKLNSDGTASYSASNGQAYDSSTGSYILENNRIVYTKKYYNYNNGTTSNNNEVTEDNKTVNFIIFDNNTLQNEVFNQIIELKK